MSCRKVWLETAKFSSKTASRKGVEDDLLKCIITGNEKRAWGYDIDLLFTSFAQFLEAIQKNNPNHGETNRFINQTVLAKHTTFVIPQTHRTWLL